MIAFVRGVISLRHHLCGYAESLRLIRFQQNAIPARIAHDVFERNPVRHRQNHFVAVIHQHLNGIEQRMLAAGRGNHFLAPVVRIEIHGMAVHNRIAQFGGSGHGGIFREVPLNRGDGGVFDVLRRREVRLARAEIDHVDSLRAQLVGLGHHRHGGGGLDAVDSFGEFQRRFQ